MLTLRYHSCFIIMTVISGYHSILAAETQMQTSDIVEEVKNAMLAIQRRDWEHRTAARAFFLLMEAACRD